MAGRSCPAGVMLQQPCWMVGVFGWESPNAVTDYNGVSGTRLVVESGRRLLMVQVDS